MTVAMMKAVTKLYILLTLVFFFFHLCNDCNVAGALRSQLHCNIVNRPAYPKILLSVLQTFCVHIFRYLIGFLLLLLWMHHQSNKTKKYQRTIFLSFTLKEQCKNLHFQWYRHTTKLTHHDTPTSAKVVLDQRLYFEKYARTSALPADFHTNVVKYGWAGRSVIIISMKITMALWHLSGSGSCSLCSMADCHTVNTNCMIITTVSIITVLHLDFNMNHATLIVFE